MGLHTSERELCDGRVVIYQRTDTMTAAFMPILPQPCSAIALATRPTARVALQSNPMAIDLWRLSVHRCSEPKCWMAHRLMLCPMWLRQARRPSTVRAADQIKHAGNNI